MLVLLAFMVGVDPLHLELAAGFAVAGVLLIPAGDDAVFLHFQVMGVRRPDQAGAVVRAFDGKGHVLDVERAAGVPDHDAECFFGAVLTAPVRNLAVIQFVVIDGIAVGILGDGQRAVVVRNG